MSRPGLTLFVLALIATDAIGQATDLAGDPLPPGAIARIGTVRYRIRGWHQQVFFSPDSRTVTAKGEQGVIRFFDAETGKVTGEIKDPDFGDWHVDQSSDGRFLAVFGHDHRGKPAPDSTLRLYDLTTRKPIWSSVNSEKYHSGYHRVRFTPDGKRLITAAQEVRIWDAKTGDELFRQQIPFGYGSLDVSPNGKTVAVGSSHLYLWDWETGAEPRKIETGLRTSFDFLRFTPNGKSVLILGSGGTNRAIDVETGKPSEAPNLGPVRWFTYSPNGELVATGSVNTGGRLPREFGVTIWNAKTNKVERHLESGRNQAGNGCWSPDGSRFAGVSDNGISVWDVKTGKLLGPEVPSHTAMISAIVFSSDGRLFTASDDHSVRAWDPANGKELMKLTSEAWVRGMDVSRDGSLVAGSGLRNDFRVWDARSGKELFKLHGHGQMGGLRKVRFSNDDQTLLSYGDDFYLRAWNTLNGKLKAEHRFRPPSRFGGGDDEDDERMMMMLGDRGSELSPDGNTFAHVAGKVVRVIAADTGKERFQFEADPQAVSMLAFSPDGKRMATTGPGVVPPKPKPGEMPDRPNDYQVIVWDLAEAKPITKFRAPGSTFSGTLMFTPDGKTVVTNSGDTIIRLWDATTGKAIGTVELPERVGRIAFDGAGKRLAVAFWDATAIVYDLPTVLKPAK